MPYQISYTWKFRSLLTVSFEYEPLYLSFNFLMQFRNETAAFVAFFARQHNLYFRIWQRGKWRFIAN